MLSNTLQLPFSHLQPLCSQRNHPCAHAHRKKHTYTHTHAHTRTHTCIHTRAQTQAQNTLALHATLLHATLMHARQKNTYTHTRGEGDEEDLKKQGHKGEESDGCPERCHQRRPGKRQHSDSHHNIGGRRDGEEPQAPQTVALPFSVQPSFVLWKPASLTSSARACKYVINCYALLFLDTCYLCDSMPA